KAPARPGAPALVTVRLSAGVHEGTLELRCLAPRGGQGSKAVSWTSPGVALAGGVQRGGTLEIWFHPDLRLSGWQSNEFCLADSAHITDTDRRITWRRLTLVGGGLATAKGSKVRRPGATVQPGSVEFRAYQLAWWRPAEGMELIVQVRYEISRGQLFGLALAV